MIYAVKPRPLSCLRVMESLNKNLAEINFYCWMWHMRLNLKKAKCIVLSQSRTIAPGYGDLTHGGAELEEENSLRILRVS